MAQRRLDTLKRLLPPNVWLGYTCGHPDSLPGLKPFLKTDATLKFQSVEPLLAGFVPPLDGIGWVIAGGESAPAQASRSFSTNGDTRPTTRRRGRKSLILTRREARRWTGDCGASFRESKGGG